MSYVRQMPEQHYCLPPDPFGTNDDWEYPDGIVDEHGWPHVPQLKPGRRLPRLGDVWECDDCGRTWVLHPPPRYANGVSFENEWLPEGRVARWRRRRRA